MDFYQIVEKRRKIDGVFVTEIYPDFIVGKHEDIMVRGEKFFAVWDEEAGLWSKDVFRLRELVDKSLYKYVSENEIVGAYRVLIMGSYETGVWEKFKKYVKSLPDSWTDLDRKITFMDQPVFKEDYVSTVAKYKPIPGEPKAYLQMTRVLYEPEEIEKIEWSIGNILCGDSRKTQKFLVLYGASGTGKSTIINIITDLVDGYYDTFDAKSIGSASSTFALSVFKDNPLVAIQHDGDLSGIEDNTRLNSVTSHELMTINEKNKPLYSTIIDSFLIMGTNSPVRITDANSGIIRRLIDVVPTGNVLDIDTYLRLNSEIKYELGQIAHHCIEVYKRLGNKYYNGYKPYRMMYNTDVFFNFVEENSLYFEESEYITLNQAYEMYSNYCEESNIKKMPKYKFRERLKSYFYNYDERLRVGENKRLRSVYSGFHLDKSNTPKNGVEEKVGWLRFIEEQSILDSICKDAPAQYASDSGTPQYKWDNVETKLSDINTNQVHFLKLPEHHIVIDFDKKNEKGEKDLELNIQAANEWPPTYAELSKSGSGIHLHYYYDGNVDILSRIFDENIEVKVFTGNSSLRRKMSKCMNNQIRTITSGLPLRTKKMMDFNITTNEKTIRSLIEKNLRKEYHAGTKPSIDFIHKILEDAFNSGTKYDVRDMRARVMAFAMGSTNQKEYCVRLVSQMKFYSVDEVETGIKDEVNIEDIVFFDTEVYPNLFLIRFGKIKYLDDYDSEGNMVRVPVIPDANELDRLLNPTPQQMEDFLKLPLVGYNCRGYDNHINYARYLGYDNQKLFELSRRIIDKSPNAKFANAFGLSYFDVLEYLEDKKSLKKHQIENGWHHMEMEIPWDQPVPDNLIDTVDRYCGNDVVSLMKLFLSKATDFAVLNILAKMSGLRLNDTITKHLGKIIFQDAQNHKTQFIYTDLSELFPGYEFKSGVSMYKGIHVSEGGYVYTEPGFYENVVLLDVESMHPTSLEQLRYFGDEFTKRYSEFKKARLFIKHGTPEKAGELLNGFLKPYLHMQGLNKALKLIINRIYGLTFTPWDNPFMLPKNQDNIVAKRGSLFMAALQLAVQEKGYTVAHIKTDSIKIPNADKEIIDFIFDFGKKYGYTFDHEATYDKMLLKDKAIYAAHDENGWSVKGAQFAHPYVFKKLFTDEEITLEDLKEVKEVKTSIRMLTDDGSDSVFVGRIGEFLPVIDGGYNLYRVDKNNPLKLDHVNGTKGYHWVEAHSVSDISMVDMKYYSELLEDAISVIERYTDYKSFCGK